MHWIRDLEESSQGVLSFNAGNTEINGASFSFLIRATISRKLTKTAFSCKNSAKNRLERNPPGEMLMPTDQTVNVSGMRPWCWLQRMARFMFVFWSGGRRWRLRPWPTCTGPCLRMPLPIGSKTVERGHAVPDHEPIITPLGQASGTAD